MKEEKPNIRDCTATACTFNQSWYCLAATIVIGDQNVPVCTTYKAEAPLNRQIPVTAEVKACNMINCVRNRERNCTAYSIKVRAGQGPPRCRSFKTRYK